MTCPSDERTTLRGSFFLFCFVMMRFILSVVLVLVALISGAMASHEASEFIRTHFERLFWFCLMMACIVSYLGFTSAKKRTR
jgi:uncharacterized membrane protein